MSRSIDSGTRFSSFCRETYALYHKPSYIDPDPLAFVRRYGVLRDREVVGFLAASLALGRVGGILRAIESVLGRLYAIDGRSPAQTLLSSSSVEIAEAFQGFTYRFFDQVQMAALLGALKRVVLEYGSIESVFAAGAIASQANPCGQPWALTMGGLSKLVSSLRHAADGLLDRSILLAEPDKGSACKRLLLFLRWMVRSDEIDPGGWRVIAPAHLLVPLDTHMISIARAFGILTSSTGSWRASVRLTEALARVDPRDPVRFDFSLSRLGIHPDIDKSEQIARSGFAETGDFATL